MKVLILWHVYDRQDNLQSIPDRYISSIESIIECEENDLSSARIKAEKDWTEKIKKGTKEMSSGTFLGKVIFAKHDVLMKVHQIVPLP